MSKSGLLISPFPSVTFCFIYLLFGYVCTSLGLWCFLGELTPLSLLNALFLPGNLCSEVSFV